MPLKQDEYKIIVTALDKTKTAFSGIEGSLKSFGSNITNLQNLFRGLLASAPFLAIADMVKKTANAGEELLKMSKQTGITTENLSLLKYAADISETSIEDLNIGMRAFSNALAGTNEEGKDTTLLLKSLGVTAKDPFEALKQVSNALRGIGDASSVSAISVDLFGRSGRTLIPLMLELDEALEKAKKNANIFTREQAEQADAFNDNITTLKTNLQGLALTLGNEVLPYLNKFFQMLSAPALALNELKNINQQIEHLQKLLEPKGAWQGIQALLFPGGKEAIEKEIADLVKKREGLYKTLTHAEPGKLEGAKGPAPNIPWSSKKIEEHFKGIFDSADKGIKELRKNFADSIKIQIDNLSELKAAFYSTYNDAIAKAKEYFEITKKAADISKGMREYLEGRKITGLKPEEAMEKEAEAFKRAYLDATDIKEYELGGLTGEDRAKKQAELFLENYQQAFTKGQSFLDKYGTTAGRAYESQVKQIEDWMGSIANRVDDIKQANEGIAKDWQDKTASILTTIDTINARITELQESLFATEFDIDVTESLKSIQSLDDKITALYDKIKNAPEMVIPAKIASSPAVPFSEGIAYMKEQLGSLPTGSDFTFDMSGISGLIEKMQVLQGLASTEKMGNVGWGLAKSGRMFPWAGELAGKTENMINNLFNVGMVQAFTEIFSQLHGHEKIDSMLQDLIEGYLGNIRSFQGLTSPIEFTKPSFIQVHPGEKLSPAGKTDINFSPTIYVSGAKDPEASAKEIDSKLADMWRTGRSRLKRTINNN